MSEPLHPALATPRATTPSPGAAPATSSFPASSTSQIADPKSSPPPPLPPTNSSPPNRPYEQIGDRVSCRCRCSRPPSTRRPSSFPSPAPHGSSRPRAVGSHRGGGSSSSSQPQASLHPQLKLKQQAASSSLPDRPSAQIGKSLRRRRHGRWQPPRIPRLSGAQVVAGAGHGGGQAEGLEGSLVRAGRPSRRRRALESDRCCTAGGRCCRGHAQPRSLLKVNPSPSQWDGDCGRGSADHGCKLSCLGESQFHISPSGFEDGRNGLHTLQRHSQPSYKEVLLGHRGCNHQGGRRRSPAVEEQGWQVVKAKRPQSSTTVQPDEGAHQQVERRSLYLRRMKGLCFNCLARDHKVASCHNQARCWRCRRFGHISTVCGSSNCEQSLSGLPDFSSGGTLTSAHDSKGISDITDESLLHIGHDSLSECDRLPDPMLHEAHLMNQMTKMSNTVGSSSVPPSSATPRRRVVSHLHLPTDEIKTPELVRSETEQLVGQELIKALGGFKQLVTPPLPPQHNCSSEKKSVGVRPKGSRSFRLSRKTKSKSQMPGFKVKRDMLTKKWVFVKKDKQLNAKQLSVLSEVVSFLEFVEALRLPL